jgi:hypothetical protein
MPRSQRSNENPFQKPYSETLLPGSKCLKEINLFPDRKTQEEHRPIIVAMGGLKNSSNADVVLTGSEPNHEILRFVDAGNPATYFSGIYQQEPCLCSAVVIPVVWMQGTPVGKRFEVLCHASPAARNI